MKHSHMWVCGVFAALTILLAAVDAGALALIPAAGGAAMCATMVWTMVRGGPKHGTHV